MYDDLATIISKPDKSLVLISQICLLHIFSNIEDPGISV